MERLKIYLDTSVISFLFADDSPEYRDITHEFFNNFLPVYDVFISETVVFEINKTSDRELRDRLLNVIKKYKIRILEINNSDVAEIEKIVEGYLGKKIIPPEKREDAIHLAICTHFGFDILLSWNFRHLANIQKQMKVNRLNQELGYQKTLNLLNPMEVIYED